MAHTLKDPEAAVGTRSPANEPQTRSPSLPASVAAVLPHAPTPLWWYMHHPRRWQCVDGEWLPLLGTLKFSLGVDGVDRHGDMDAARINVEKRGWKVIPWEIGDYIKETPCQGGLLRHSRWEKPRSIGGMVLPSEIDEAGYRDFLRMLVADGHVGKPDPAMIDAAHVDAQRKRTDKVRSTPAQGMAPIVAREEARLKEMEAATAKIKPGRAA